MFAHLSRRFTSACPPFACTYVMFAETSRNVSSTSPRFVRTYTMFTNPPLAVRLHLSAV